MDEVGSVQTIPKSEFYRSYLQQMLLNGEDEKSFRRKYNLMGVRYVLITFILVLDLVLIIIVLLLMSCYTTMFLTLSLSL